ncbi:hypothetical protein IT409_02355 [Candidatus Falkowbacteria bacterium]|nr:hypothetical protein [Candidatus Falkowbacteria bacterium]
MSRKLLIIGTIIVLSIMLTGYSFAAPTVPPTDPLVGGQTSGAGSTSTNTSSSDNSVGGVQAAINSLEATTSAAGLPKQTLGATLKKVIDNVIGLLGAAFLILCIYGGLRMMFSKGDEKAYAEGRKTISWGVIGMIVILVSYGIVDLLFGVVVPGISGQ